MIFARICCALIAVFEFTTLTSEHTCSTRIERVHHTIRDAAQEDSQESASASAQGTRSSMTMKVKRFRIAFRCTTYTWPLSDENIYEEMRETNVLFELDSCREVSKRLREKNRDESFLGERVRD